METEEEYVKRFAQAMTQKVLLRKDRYAPFGWKTMDIQRLLLLLKGEIKEFEKADSDERKASEAVDIANYALFMWALLQHDTD